MDIETILRCLAYLANFLANAPKACGALSKGWACFTEFLRTLDSPEVPEDAPSPPEIVSKHAFDGISMGLNEGYPAHRHRQNAAAYYTDGPDVSIQLTGGIIRASGGRLIDSLS